jgi:DnaJ-class molecular chaperone
MRNEENPRKRKRKHSPRECWLCAGQRTVRGAATRKQRTCPECGGTGEEGSAR